MAGIGDIVVNFIADTAKFVAGTNKASSELSRFASKAVSLLTAPIRALTSLNGLIGLTVTGLSGVATLRSLNAAAETLDHLGDVSHRLGIGVQQLSALKFAAGEAGVDFDTLSKLVGKAQKNMAAVANTAGAEAADAFGTLGVPVRDVSGNLRDITDVLPELAAALSRTSSQAEQLRLAEKIFGRAGGAEFVQLLHDSGDFMQNLAVQTERAKRLGVLFTPAQVQIAQDFRDAIERIGQAWLGLRVKVLEQIGPWLTEVAHRVATFIAAVPELLAKLVDKIREAFTGGPGNQARKQFQAFADSIIELLRVSIVDGALVLMPWAVTAIRAVIDALATELLPGLVRMVIEAFVQLGSLLPSIAAKAGLPKFMQMAMNPVGAAAGAIGLTPELVKKFADEIIMTTTPLAALNKALVMMPDMTDALSRAWVQLAQDVSAAGGELGAAADNLLGFGAILARHDVGPALEKFRDQIRAATPEVDELAVRFTNLGQKVTEGVSGFSTRVSDAFADLVVDGKAAFADLLKAFEKMLLSMAAEELLFRPFFSQLGQAFGGGVGGLPGLLSGANYGGGSATTGPTGFFGPGQIPDFAGPGGGTAIAAHGMAIDAGRILAFARGGVVRRPTLFPMASGTGLMGEAGPEAVMPLRRIGGDLGVRATGMGTVVQIIDQRAGGAPAQVAQTTGPDGRKVVRVLIRDEVRKMVGDGSIDRSMGSAYGVGRRGVSR